MKDMIYNFATHSLYYENQGIDAAKFSLAIDTLEMIFELKTGKLLCVQGNPDLRPGIYGRTTAANPNVIEIGPHALMNKAELANTIAHELNHARDFIKGGVAPESSAYSAGNALSDYINGER